MFKCKIKEPYIWHIKKITQSWGLLGRPVSIPHMGSMVKEMNWSNISNCIVWHQISQLPDQRSHDECLSFDKFYFYYSWNVGGGGANLTSFQCNFILKVKRILVSFTILASLK